MYKEQMEKQLDIIWRFWLIAEDKKNRLRFNYDEKFLTKFNADYNTEMFLSDYYDKLTDTQKEFANNILQAMVEIQNHDNIPNEIN